MKTVAVALAGGLVLATAIFTLILLLDDGSRGVLFRRDDFNREVFTPWNAFRVMVFPLDVRRTDARRMWVTPSTWLLHWPLLVLACVLGLVVILIL